MKINKGTVTFTQLNFTKIIIGRWKYKFSFYIIYTPTYQYTKSKNVNNCIFLPIK